MRLSDNRFDLIFEGHEQLAQILRSISGKFMLSINDHTTMRDLCKDVVKAIIDCIGAEYPGGKSLTSDEVMVIVNESGKFVKVFFDTYK